MNRANESATVRLAYYDQSPTLVVTATLELAPLSTVHLPPPATLPTSFVGLITARSNRSLIGLLVQRHVGDGIDVVPAQEGYTLGVSAAEAATLHYALPRILRDVDLGGGPRLTKVFAAYAGDEVAQGDFTLYTTGGWTIGSAAAFSMASKESWQYIATEPTNPTTAGVINTDRPLVVIEETDYIAASPYATATYSDVGPLSCANRLPLPVVRRQQNRYSIIYVQNRGLDTADITITYRDRNGVTQALVNAEIPGTGTQLYDLRQTANLPADFVGSAELYTPDMTLCAQVDEYLVGQPTGVEAGGTEATILLPSIFAP
jgi:hypothetical protein